ncbi:type IV toxin-antitoxin system AbiEi family antitoxin [Marinobacter salarius]|uniref:type IV toxin-antitoxin system AbiEi family antitoxin n=1 Tax=Marinobacter salarius TaxID=1420917 RepID=UPI000F8584BC|nr:type IV toxin-antitoxin system AbiEi family antitoxin [Marinobacter salarius]AZR41260.1 hypothetical protein MTMN5_01810 [Marinobacter salarius]
MKRNYKRTLKSLVPYGMLATKKWLTQQGLSTHSLDNAVKTETLLPLATGVYSQYNRSVSWEGVVASMQFMEMEESAEVPSVVVGGQSALHLSGLTHHLPLGKRPRVHLYAASKLPAWIRRLSLPIDFVGHSANKLWPDWLFSEEALVQRLQWAADLPPLLFSCPEKAILEILADVPGAITFEHVDELMHGMVSLSPKKLDTLLRACKSVKVKRLFLWFAERHAHQWSVKLRAEEYNLGSGKRVIAKNGKLDPTYLITVPLGNAGDIQA